MDLFPKNTLSLAGILLVSIAAYYVINKIVYGIRIRRRFHDIPMPQPRHWLWGNLIQAGDKLNPSLDRHPDYGFEEMWEEIDRPAMFMVDIAPINAPLLVIADPTLAEQIAQPSAHYKYSMTKSATGRAMERAIGTDSMIMLEGEQWRDLRKRFNKGFSPSHLHTLSMLVVDKINIFVDRLKREAQKGEIITLQTYAQDLVTDIITTMVIEKDFGAQSVPEGEGPKSTFGFLTASRKLPGLTYKIGQGVNFHFLDPIRPLKAWYYERIQNQTLDQLIRSKLKADRDSTTTDSQSKTSTPTKAKAIVQLALAGLTPTEALIHNTRTQIKTFLFAGQDTTATVIQWLCYELSRANHNQDQAQIIKTLRDEHDKVFGPDNPFSALETLNDPTKSETILGDKLPYTTAFIKETMRIHPPAGSARECNIAMSTSHSPNRDPVTLTTAEGTTVQIDGARVYLCHYLIQRNPAVWGADAHEFKPGRWLDEEYVRSLPTGAWRPFERGPRNCVGQELAMMELKIVLCALARAFVFEKVGLTGRDGQREVYSVHNITSIPVDGMRMKVGIRN